MPSKLGITHGLPSLCRSHPWLDIGKATPMVLNRIHLGVRVVGRMMGVMGDRGDGGGVMKMMGGDGARLCAMACGW